MIIPMFEYYKDIINESKKYSLDQERKLIALAKKGDEQAKNEVLLSNISFFLFRINTTLYPKLAGRFGEDILQECLLLANEKVYRYNLRYKNKQGERRRVYFRSYIWKGVTGVIMRSIKNKREKTFSDMFNDEALCEKRCVKNAFRD